MDYQQFADRTLASLKASGATPDQAAIALAWALAWAFKASGEPNPKARLAEFANIVLDVEALAQTADMH